MPAFQGVARVAEESSMKPTEVVFQFNRGLEAEE